MLALSLWIVALGRLSGGMNKDAHSMNDELARQLKDAGFPQSHDGCLAVEKSQAGAGFCADRRENELNGHTAYVPTLEELIDACDGQFSKLTSTGSGFYAVGTKISGLSEYTKHCPTPIEAMAKLWLALNRKP